MIRCQHIPALVGLLFVLSISTALGQETTQDRWNLILGEDGKFSLVQDLLSEQISSEATKLVGESAFAQTLMKEPNSIATDWYQLTLPSGAEASVFAVPAGQIPPAVLFKSMEPGSTLAKIETPSWFHVVVPNSDQVRGMLEALMSNAREAVCGMSIRPSTFGSEVDVSAGIGITGRIQFNVSWETSELCAN